MTKSFLLYRQKRYEVFCCALCTVLIILVSACSDVQDTSSETGSIAFSIKWKDAPTIQTGSRAIQAESLDCEAAGVATVSFDIYDENNSFLVGDSWPCSYHQGTVDGVLVGFNRKLEVSGEDSNGNVLYRGEKSGISVRAGETTDVGAVEVEPPNWNEDFSSYNSEMYYIEGDAYWDNVNEYFVLTEASQDKKGRIYFTTLLNTAVWAAEFDVKMGGGTGSDGLTFAFVRDYTGDQCPGGSLDFCADGYAVEFDSYCNHNLGDPLSNHVAVIQNDTSNHLVYADLDIEDSNWHHVKINFNNGDIIVQVDSNEIINYTISDFEAFMGYFGFTAATGDLTNWHIIDNIQLSLDQVSAPSAPINVSTIAGDEQVTISWDSVSGATSYNIYWSTSLAVSKTDYEGKIEDITSTSYLHTGLTNGTTYYYVVTTENDYGESDESSEVSATPSYIDLNDGLVAYYPFNGNANDESGNGNHGTEYGVGLTEDRFGNANSAYSFDGVDDKISIPSSVISGTTLTVNFWVKTDDDTFALISGANSLSHNEYLLYVHENSNLQIYYHDNVGYHGTNYYVTNVSVNDNLWHMLTIITEIDQTILYVDGFFSEVTNYGSVTDFSVEGLWIGAEQDCVNGCWESVQQLKGGIDDIRIYNRALSEAEIQALYNATRSPPAPINVIATEGNEQVTISWDSVSGATSYNIYWSTSLAVSKTDYEGKIEDITQTSYTHTGLTNDITYYYVITAANSYGESDESSEVSATPMATTAWWVQLDGGGVPNSGMGCAYDSIRNRGVIFGGNYVDSTIHSDTYEWDGSTWAFITSEGPSARGSSEMAFDKMRGRTVLFGGWVTPDNYHRDTWEWDGTQWNKASTSGPHARANQAMAYDRSRGKTVLFGGSYYQTIYGDTWEWDGTSWTQVSSSGPSPRIFARMVYDESRGKIVLFGGQTTYYGTFLNDTWEWDGTSWTQVASTGPTARAAHMMAYCPLGQGVVLFGGGGWGRGECFNDTWEWDGTSWSQINAYGPSERQTSCMFFDEIRQSVILFGGAGPDGTLGDTWEYSPTEPTE